MAYPLAGIAGIAGAISCRNYHLRISEKTLPWVLAQSRDFNYVSFQIFLFTMRRFADPS